MPERPVSGGRFTVEIADELTAEQGVARVEFPQTRLEVIAYRDGTDRRTRFLPGRAVPGRVVLHRAVEPDSPLFDWWRRTRDGQAERRPMSIVLLDDTHQEVVRWNLFECWPSAYRVSDLDTRDSEVVTEIVEIVYGWLEQG